VKQFKKLYNIAKENNLTKKQFVKGYSIYLLRTIKWKFFRALYKTFKCPHKHIYDWNIFCIICKKSKMDIDRKKFGVDKNDN
jgi:hypothetical protein